MRVIAFLAAAGLAAGGFAQTADELVEKNIRARGGLEKIRAVQSVRMTGTMEIAGEGVPTVLELKRPGRLRWEFTLEGQTVVQACDETTGWTVMPFEGKTEPEKMPDAEFASFRRQADIDGPLVDFRAKGYRIELLGKDATGGREAWKLKVVASDGEERIVFLDAETFLQVKTLSPKKVDGNDIEIESVVGDYRPVAGVQFPHSFESTAKGMPQKQVMKFERIEVNAPMDDSRFAMPRPAPPAPPAPPSAS
jgi:outer membrane lipoprotein-sorting protein